MTTTISKPRIVIAGGSGLIGNALRKLFEDTGYEVIVLSRSRREENGVHKALWDGETLGDWVGVLDGAVAVINLAGEPITLRWTEENKRKILESRTKSTAVIGRAIRACANPPKVWVNGSAVGYYGDRYDEVDESSPAGEGFLAETCLAWERAQEDAETPQTRKVRVRIGIALGRDSGAFKELSKLTKRFLGGAQGSGKQWMPWIHLDDLAAVFKWAVEFDFSGPVNGVGPAPIQNADFMAAMRKVAGRPWSPPAPKFALKLAGLFMGMQTDVVLESQRAKSKVLAENGFQYDFPELEGALKDLFQEKEESTRQS